MRIRDNLRRIAKFMVNNRNNLFSINFWRTVRRVWEARFFYLRTIRREEFIRNIQQIELRPWNLHIELTNICNSNCLFCAYQFQKRKKLIMDKDVYSKSLNDYCAIAGGELCLESCVGDPLLHPDFILKVREARSHSEIAKIITTTNGINLHNTGIDEFLHSGINEVKISTAPWDEKLYKLIYRSDCYFQMRKNITELLRKNLEYAKPVTIKLLFRSNLSMDETLNLKDYREIRFLPHEVEFNTDFDTWLGTIKQGDLIKGMHVRPFTPHDKEPCYWLYDGPIIFADGKVGLCGCRDYNADSELIVGNILEESLWDIWHSEKVSMLRARFWKADQPAICKRCTAYVNIDIYRSKFGSERARIIAERFASKKRI